MGRHTPDRIGIVDYLEGILEPDASRAMAYHLKGCEACRAALEEERALLQRLESMARAEAPADFVAAVMGRVAQRPAYRPSQPVPWRQVATLAGGLAAALLVTLVGGVWALGRSGELAEAGVGDHLGYLVVQLVKLGSFVGALVGPILDKGVALFDGLATAISEMVTAAAGASWWVQLGVLILAVTANYAFTRLVLAYQRRR